MSFVSIIFCNFAQKLCISYEEIHNMPNNQKLIAYKNFQSSSANIFELN